MENPVQDTKKIIETLLLTLLISLWLYWLWSRWTFYRFALKFPGCFGLPVIGSFDTIKDFKSE